MLTQCRVRRSTQTRIGPCAMTADQATRRPSPAPGRDTVRLRSRARIACDGLRAHRGPRLANAAANTLNWARTNGAVSAPGGWQPGGFSRAWFIPRPASARWTAQKALGPWTGPCEAVKPSI